MRDYSIIDEPHGPSMEDLYDDNRVHMECTTCQREVEVTETHDTPGFASGWVTVFDLDCGHQVVDVWGDDLAAVK